MVVYASLVGADSRVYFLLNLRKTVLVKLSELRDELDSIS